jgi:hypothetical protein
MNERIKKFHNQAIEELDPSTVVGSFSEAVVQRVAELIVKECLDITDAHKEVFQTHQDKAFIEHIKQSVKTHFGVE